MAAKNNHGSMTTVLYYLPAVPAVIIIFPRKNFTGGEMKVPGASDITNASGIGGKMKTFLYSTTKLNTLKKRESRRYRR